MKYVVLLSSYSVFLIFLFLGIFTHHYLHAPGLHEEEKRIVIPSPSSLHSISALLEKENIIRHKFLFFALSAVYTRKQSYQAGEYTIPAHISPAEIMELLQSGKVYVHKFLIPEGFTVKQITAFLLHESTMKGDIPDNIEEGSLFPNTYHYFYGEKRETLLKRMQKKQHIVLQQEWENRDISVPFTTSQEALILASIVEKEAKISDERALIARVFINRLLLNMPLQADPTILYAVSEKLGTLNRPLYEKDLKFPSPYNSYKVKGLPPTPICNPGRDTIYATLHPAISDALYFVANGQGGHLFASTLSEHNKNVKLYRALQKSLLAP